MVGTCLFLSTFLKNEEKGSPLSRANEKTTRELCAKRKAKLTRAMMVMQRVRARAAAREFVPSYRIWMSGTPVAVVAAAFMSVMQKQIAMRKMKPVTAPIQTAQMMAFGASFLAFASSSVI